jgi:hypothetical protein
MRRTAMKNILSTLLVSILGPAMAGGEESSSEHAVHVSIEDAVAAVEIGDVDWRRGLAPALPACRSRWMVDL